jgi:hypothetical protein
VVTFLWRTPGYRSKYTVRHVDILRRMVRRNYDRPHRFVLITDDAAGLNEPDIECFQLWDDLSQIKNPSGANNPSCYRRLKLFAPNTAEWLGPRFVCVDLDTVIVGNMAPLWDRPEDFVIWRSPGGNQNPYCGSMWMLRAGARPQVWLDFDPVRSPIETIRHGLFGSDQAWIAHRLGPNEATWGPEHGALSYRMGGLDRRPLPGSARIVFFHGKPDPDEQGPQSKLWVRRAYQ